MKHTLFSLMVLLLIATGTSAQLETKKDTNGKYGYVDYEDNWVVQPQYDEANGFDDLTFAFAKLKGKWGLIDLQGKVVIPFSFDKIIYDNDYYFGDEQIITVVKNNKYGMVSRTSGKVFVECVYEKGFAFDEGLFYQLGTVSVVYRNKKAGLLNEKGVEIVPCIYDGGKQPFTSLDDYFVLVKQNKKIGVLDTVGHPLLPCQFEKVEISDSMSEMFQVKKNGKYGLYSFEGKEIITPLYDAPFYFEGEYGVAKLKGKYGVINRKGEAVVPFTYSNESDALDEMLKLYEN
jgi:WG containing repeat